MAKKILILALGLVIFTGCGKNEEISNKEEDLVSIEDISSEDLNTIDDLKDDQSKENPKKEAGTQNKNERKNDDKKDEESEEIEEETEEVDPILAELSGKSLAYRHPSYRFYHGIDFLDNGHFISEHSMTTRDMEREVDLVQKCIMEGDFVVEEKLDDYSYTLRLVNPRIISNTGEVEKEEGRETYYVDKIGGFDIGEYSGNFQDLYTLYLPGKDKNAMTDTLKQRLNILVMDFEGDNLPCFMLVNNSSYDPFVDSDFVE